MGKAWQLPRGLGRGPFHRALSRLIFIIDVSYCGLPAIKDSFVLILKMGYRGLHYTKQPQTIVEIMSYAA